MSLAGLHKLNKKKKKSFRELYLDANNSRFMQNRLMKTTSIWITQTKRDHPKMKMD